MKTHSVKTWKERPAMATSMAALLFPEDMDDRAPPIAWRTRERMSQGCGQGAGVSMEHLEVGWQGFEIWLRSVYSPFMSRDLRFGSERKKKEMEAHTMNIQ